MKRLLVSMWCAVRTVATALMVVVIAVLAWHWIESHAGKIESVVAAARSRLNSLAGIRVDAQRNASAGVASVAGALLATEQELAVEFLARRYRVGEHAMRKIVQHAYAAADEFGLDPALVLAVMAVESSMNPIAESPAGAQGLMQVLTRVHIERLARHGGASSAFEPDVNIRVGASILRDMIARGGSIEGGLKLYVGAGRLTTDGGYAQKVIRERDRIRSATGKNVEA